MSEKKRTEELLEEFKTYFPGIIDDNEIYYPRYIGARYVIEMIDDMTLEVTDNGTGALMVYDSFYKSCRYINLFKKPIMTKSVWKKEFSNRLRRIMHVKGFTNNAISDASGLSTATITEYLNGRRIPSAYNLKKLAVALGTTIENLIDFDKYYD